MSRPQCFVLMPFDESYRASYDRAIKPVSEALGYECHREDDYGTPDVIARSIVRHIWEADLVVADLTDLNPNVLYELGIVHAMLKQNVIVVARTGQKLPFDLAHYRTLFYDDSNEGHQDPARRLDEAINAITKSDETTNPMRLYCPELYLARVSTRRQAQKLADTGFDTAVTNAQETLVLQGPNLVSLVMGDGPDLVRAMIQKPSFRKLELVTLDSGSDHSRGHVGEYLAMFLRGIEDVFQGTDAGDVEVLCYATREFLRYSAAYIDHEAEDGSIRCTTPLYGAKLEVSPFYVLTRRGNRELYERLVQSWEELRRRLEEEDSRRVVTRIL